MNEACAPLPAAEQDAAAKKRIVSEDSCAALVDMSGLATGPLGPYEPCFVHLVSPFKTAALETCVAGWLRTLTEDSCAALVNVSEIGLPFCLVPATPQPLLVRYSAPSPRFFVPARRLCTVTCSRSPGTRRGRWRTSWQARFK